MDQEERYIAGVAYEDLAWMRNEWVSSTLDDGAVRRASGTLRRLLVDDDYGRAWRTVGLPRQPVVRALDFEKYVVSRGGPVLLDYGQAGGATGADLEVRLVLNWRDVRVPNSEQPNWTEFERDYPLSDFLTSTCMYVDERPIRRRHVIKYVANRLGGPHAGIAGTPAKERNAFQLLDSSYDKWFVAERRAIYLEMLAIGYAVAQSPDLERFMRAAEAALD